MIGATYTCALTPARLVPGTPVFGGSTRTIGVIASLPRPNGLVRSMEEVEVVWAGGSRRWVLVRDLNDLDLYLDAAEASFRDLLDRRNALTSRGLAQIRVPRV